MSEPSKVQAKETYSTGEAAKVTRLSQQTIIRWCDRGMVASFKVPGSRFRRIPREDLHEFMRKNGIAIEGENAALSGPTVENAADSDQQA